MSLLTFLLMSKTQPPSCKPEQHKLVERLFSSVQNRPEFGKLIFLEPFKVINRPRRPLFALLLNRGCSDRSRLRHPSDLRDEEWALVEPRLFRWPSATPFASRCAFRAESVCTTAMRT